MRSYALTSLMYSRVLTKELRRNHGLKLHDFELLILIDNEQRINKEGFCTVKEIKEYNSGVSLDMENLLNSIKLLISSGFVENIGKIKYKLIVTGKGDYVIRDFVKSLHRKIIAKEGKENKRLKYSFIDKTY